MSTMTQKISEAGSGQGDTNEVGEGPKKGERYRCGKCGMEVEVTVDCRCHEPSGVHFHCCGQELQKL